MYEFLGFVNIFLVVVLASPYLLRLVNQGFLHTKDKRYFSLLKLLHTVHKIAGGLLVVNIFIHGYLALGGLRLHTGTVTGACFILTAFLGFLFFITKKPAILKIHRVCLFISIGVLVVHLLVPSLLGR